MTHICVIKLTIGSDNGLSPGRRQAIISANAAIWLIGSLGTKFSEILFEISYIFIQENGFENVVCKMAAILSGPNVLMFEYMNYSYKLQLEQSTKWRRYQNPPSMIHAGMVFYKTSWGSVY